MKIGRNELCPCGSGLKFKHCHGDVNRIHADENLEELTRQVEKSVHTSLVGFGRPVVALTPIGEDDLRRVILVGRRAFRGLWRTFHDFLMHYMASVLSDAWIIEESKRSEPNRHPILHWVDRMQAQRSSIGVPIPGMVYSTPFTGASLAFFLLAYDLYTLEHNGSHPSDPDFANLIKRLKNVEQFHGALFELRAAACCLRAGFKLEWEDGRRSVDQRRASHCEFVAFMPTTGRKFSVECKKRQAERHDPSSLDLPVVSRKLVQALRKPAPYPRIVFLDLDTPIRREDWSEWVVRNLANCEHSVQGLPSAYVFIMYMPIHHHLEEVQPLPTFISVGFKMPGYVGSREDATLRQRIESRADHAEAESLRTSMVVDSAIPHEFPSGNVRPTLKRATTDLDLYDQFLPIYSKYSKDALLRQVAGHEDAESLAELSREQLADVVSERLALAAYRVPTGRPEG